MEASQDYRHHFTHEYLSGQVVEEKVSPAGNGETLCVLVLTTGIEIRATSPVGADAARHDAWRQLAVMEMHFASKVGWLSRDDRAIESITPLAARVVEVDYGDSNGATEARLVEPFLPTKF